MSILLLADHDNTSLESATFHAVTAATQIGGDVHVLVAGGSAAPAAQAAAAIPGVAKVLHADAAWSRERLDAPPAAVQAELVERFAARIGEPLPPVAHASVHRWRHARVESPVGEPWLADWDAALAFCGDWCLDARVEAAFLSGDALGAAIAGRLLR